MVLEILKVDMDKFDHSQIFPTTIKHKFNKKLFV